MKTLFNIFCGTVMILMAVSCSEETLVDETIDGVVSGGILRALDITNGLDSSDLNSTYSILLEAQDNQGGSLLSEVRVNVGFNDIDGQGTDTVALTPFTTIPASAFTETSPTTNNLPVGRFTVSLAELENHVGTTRGQYSLTNAGSKADNFVIDFEMVLTDGRTFNLSNATGDVTRTGRFSFFNAQFRYAVTVDDPKRLEVVDISIAKTSKVLLDSGTVDTVFVTYDRSIFDTHPTIERISSEGFSNDTIGELLLWDDEDNEDDEIYFFLYTAGNAPTDTISFRLRDGIATPGFPSYPVTIKEAFIIDNAITPALSSVSVIDNNTVDELQLTFNFGEDLVKGTATFEVDGGGFFDNFTVEQAVADGDESLTITFTPELGGNPVALQNLDFNVTINGPTDIAGNQVENEIVNVDIL